MSAVVDVARRAVWIFRGVMGEHAYDDYLAHHRATHAGGDPMTAREFWRDRTDEQERHPEGRCC